MKKLLLFLLTTLLILEPTRSQVVLNEFMSSNNSTIADEDGEYSDWIEIYNAGPDIANLSGYSLSDDDYDLFKAFIEENEFQFQTASEQAFEELLKTAKREKYYALAEAEFASLEEKLSHNNLKDLETFEEEIRQILTEEIVNHYYYLAGRIQSQIQEDAQLDKAREILREPGMLKEVLQGNQGALAKATE